MINIALSAARMYTLSQVRQNLRDHDLTTYAEHSPDLEPALEELQARRDQGADDLSHQVQELEATIEDLEIKVVHLRRAIRDARQVGEQSLRQGAHMDWEDVGPVYHAALDRVVELLREVDGE